MDGLKDNLSIYEGCSLWFYDATYDLVIRAAPPSLDQFIEHKGNNHETVLPAKF